MLLLSKTIDENKISKTIEFATNGDKFFIGIEENSKLFGFSQAGINLTKEQLKDFANLINSVLGEN